MDRSGAQPIDTPPADDTDHHYRGQQMGQFSNPGGHLQPLSSNDRTTITPQNGGETLSTPRSARSAAPRRNRSAPELTEARQLRRRGGRRSQPAGCVSVLQHGGQPPG